MRHVCGCAGGAKVVSWRLNSSHAVKLFPLMVTFIARQAVVAAAVFFIDGFVVTQLRAGVFYLLITLAGLLLCPPLPFHLFLLFWSTLTKLKHPHPLDVSCLCCVWGWGIYEQNTSMSGSGALESLLVTSSPLREREFSFSGGLSHRNAAATVSQTHAPPAVVRSTM